MRENLHSLIDWEWCRAHRSPVTWDDLVDDELRVHITIATRAWLKEELRDPELHREERVLYRRWLDELERSQTAARYPFGFVAHKADDGVWDLIVPEEELTPERIADYVRAFSETMKDRLEEPYEFVIEG